MIGVVAGFILWSGLVSAKDKHDTPTVEIKCLLTEEKAAEFSRKVSSFFDFGAMWLCPL